MLNNSPPGRVVVGRWTGSGILVNGNHDAELASPHAWHAPFFAFAHRLYRAGDRLAGHKDEIHSTCDKKLEEARERRRMARQNLPQIPLEPKLQITPVIA